MVTLPFGTSVGSWKIEIPSEGSPSISHDSNKIMLPEGSCSVKKERDGLIIKTNGDPKMFFVIKLREVSMYIDDNTKVASLGDFDESELYRNLVPNFPESIEGVTDEPGAVEEDPMGGRRRKTRARKTRRRHK